MLENHWQSRLGFIDKFILSYIMGPRLEAYRYGKSKTKGLGLFLVPLLILLPLSYERRFWSPAYLIGRLPRGQIKTVASNGTNYLRRVLTFLKFYQRTVTGQSFKQPLLTPEVPISEHEMDESPIAPRVPR